MRNVQSILCEGCMASFVTTTTGKVDDDVASTGVVAGFVVAENGAIDVVIDAFDAPEFVALVVLELPTDIRIRCFRKSAV